MKKTVVLGLILTLIFTSACLSSSTETTNESVSESAMDTSPHDIKSEDYSEMDIRKKIEAAQQKELEMISNASQKPHEQLITKTYSEKEAFEKRLVYYLADDPGVVSYFAIGLSDLERDFPVECLRRTGEQKVYALYKTNEGGLIYTFVEEGGRGEKGWVVTHSLYVKKALVKSDFDAVKKGDSIKKVNKIDPTVELYLNRWNERYSMLPYFATAHLTKEGIVTIIYYKQRNEYRVESLEVSPDFVFDIGRAFDCTILPQDFPE
ncbi:MAG: hypothetical protein FWH42_05950 [Dehalococcoidia bacterium]|nr:hypothetical protein [Dehalococcoidia bacterium]